MIDPKYMNLTPAEARLAVANMDITEAAEIALAQSRDNMHSIEDAAGKRCARFVIDVMNLALTQAAARRRAA